MRTVAELSTVSTDDLVNSLINSVTSGSSSTSASASASSASASASASSAASASASSSATSSSSSSSSPATVVPATSSPATTTASSASASTTTAPETATGATSDGSDASGGSSAGLSIGIAVGVLAIVVAVLLFLRSRKKRSLNRQSDCTPAGRTAAGLTGPGGRGFAQDQRELGMPEMSIELPPPTARFTSSSKGGDLSIRSSAFSSVRSSASSHNPYSASTTSSRDSSVFNTVGGVSPSSSNRKMGGFAYQYRASNDSEVPSTRSAGSTTFRLTQLAGANSGRGGTTKLSRVPSGRTLTSADEYEELQSATNAQSTAYTVEMDHVVEMSAPIRSHNPADDSSAINMDPDAAVVGRNKRTGSVYDTIPALAGESMSPPASHMSSAPSSTTYTSPAASRPEPSVHRRAPPPPPPPMAPLPPMEVAEPGSYVSELPMLQSLSSASESDYGEDHSTQRASTTSTDSGNTTRSGSLIALIEAKDGGGSEVAI